MKHLLAILIFTQLMSCKHSKPSIIDEVNKQANSNEKNSEKALILSNEVQIVFPNWIKTIKNTKNKVWSRYGNNHEINSLNQLNDSLSYAIFSITDGVCLMSELETYWNKRKVDSLEIGKSCDHDLSLPTHSWKEYKFITTTKIKISEFTEFVPDSLITEEGHVKEGYDFIKSETKTDTIFKTYRISNEGNIIEMN
ncbi:hypothetical protein FIA58_017675 [Flavobacterium jejuense]|uniref:Uncharacterized protein n=1 Tax=Flavobacterium jejuense TaxID=1544455 RepID=A0ABX0IVL6_9FLAO|nr:hypothetical protein [Flavobacterium jejuense]NHN27513.1 hypothetical protein [Flavobacterium jejuense]